MVAIKGRPKSMKGCFARAVRYREAIVLASAVPRNLRLGKAGMLIEESWSEIFWRFCLGWNVVWQMDGEEAGLESAQMNG
jgi:hypothetical protein